MERIIHTVSPLPPPPPPSQWLNDGSARNCLIVPSGWQVYAEKNTLSCDIYEILFHWYLTYVVVIISCTFIWRYKLKFVYRPSSIVRCVYRNYLRTYSLYFFQIPVVTFHRPYVQKKMHFPILQVLFLCSLTWGPVGAKTSKHYSHKSLLNLFHMFF